MPQIWRARSSSQNSTSLNSDDLIDSNGLAESINKAKPSVCKRDRSLKYGPDSLAYYHAHLEGKTLTELRSEHNGFYQRLSREGNTKAIKLYLKEKNHK
jgi:hypothetical protein